MENPVTLGSLRVGLEAGLGSGHEALLSSEEGAVMVASPTEGIGICTLGLFQKVEQKAEISHYRNWGFGSGRV